MNDDRDTYARIIARRKPYVISYVDALGIKRVYPGKSRTIRESDWIEVRW